MPAGRPSSPVRVRRSDNERPVLSARAGAVLGVLVVLLAILAIPFKEWLTQRARIAELESELAWHTDRVVTLTDTLQRWEDPAYIEAQARERLQFVKPGEVGYVVLTEDPAAAQEADEGRSLAQAPTGLPWWSAVWTTVEQVADPDNGGGELTPKPATPASSFGR